ncbi:MAG TPA: DUF559 domain-containing protein [Allosphingosinicella sp.]|nr:DUF559 domain-containing protein [Allosphingosinicella sp.]
MVEIDGDTHEAARDAGRDAHLAALGFTTIRFTNDDVRDNMDSVLTNILERLDTLPDCWPEPSLGPTPNPSPEGEGLPS